jgi:hypothetical protein
MTYTIKDIEEMTGKIKERLNEALADNVLTPDEAADINKMIEKLGEMIFEDGVMTDEEKELADSIFKDAMFKMKEHLENKQED